MGGGWMDGIAGGGRQNQKLEGDLETSVPAVARRYVLGFQVESFVARPGKLPDRGRMGWGIRLGWCGLLFQGVEGEARRRAQICWEWWRAGQKRRGLHVLCSPGLWVADEWQPLDGSWLDAARPMFARERATLPSFARADLRDLGWFFQVVASLRGCTQHRPRANQALGSDLRQGGWTPIRVGARAVALLEQKAMRHPAPQRRTMKSCVERRARDDTGQDTGALFGGLEPLSP